MLSEDRRRALEAAAAGRHGSGADAAMSLLWALIAANSHLADKRRRRAVWAYIAAAFVRCIDSTAEEHAWLEQQGMSLDEMIADLVVGAADSGWSDAIPTDRSARLTFLRALARTVQDPFDQTRLRQLLA
jgi:hypothetical protein